MEVTCAFYLNRDLAVVKVSAVTSRFAYVKRRRRNNVNSVKTREFLSLSFDVLDSPERPWELPN